ncbi:unnamed protein product [Parnassius apollo]|uniref:(apollo) hypothetical protein n=1 Tax=Parnassius apollo TaxID=110799 RepID=A0A8S3WVS3_PARAO|nr:unnamed protein product [Parnassius apollo]
MDIPIFTKTTYAQVKNKVYEKWESTSVESMAAAAMRERDAAIAEETLSKDDIPLIDIYADACWIQTILQSLLSKSRSLLEDVDNNAVESFNDVIAKVVGER